MDVEQTMDSILSKKDKKSKKSKNPMTALLTPDTESPIDSAAEMDGERKKKKKRKHEENGDSEVSEKKDKKKHKKKDRNDAETASGGVGESSASGSSKSAAPTAEEVQGYLKSNAITINSLSGDVTPILNFDQLSIPASLRSALRDFTSPTPIQACAWPPLLEGKDVVGIAETGSGKTLAFGLPALNHLISSNTATGKNNNAAPVISVLVVAPTRELAIQTHDTLLALGEPFNITSVCIFGGVDKDGQKRALASNQGGKQLRIVVGTPGRILDLVNEGACDLSGVTYLVLDEADRMLDKGFENDIRRIISYTKQGIARQTLMFSATWPESVRRLAGSFQRDPVRVTVGRDELTANSKVEQVVEVFDDPRSKDGRLASHLKHIGHQESKKADFDEARVLVFVLYKKEASRVEGYLKRLGYRVGGIHGDLGQGQRIKALDDFKTGRTGLLVATDVAARGLDIPNVGTVINYSFPLTIEDYIHRIGRTGRGGRSGKSITFFTGENHERSIAGELSRVLKDGGFNADALQKFPMTLKKKEHGAYGAFFRDDIPVPSKPTKIVF